MVSHVATWDRGGSLGNPTNMRQRALAATLMRPEGDTRLFKLPMTLPVVFHCNHQLEDIESL